MSPKEIVDEAKKRFKRAQEAYSDSRKKAIADTKFAMGDSDNLWQWPEEVRQARQGKACLTINGTAQHCNQIINAIRQNRPSVKVSPVDNGADKETANIFAGLIRNIQADSSADDAHDLAAEHSIYGGEGYWRVITEYESPTSFDQVIKIKPCPNPQQVFIDCDCKELDKSDAQWGFIFEDISIEQFRREYPKINPESWVGAESQGWHNEETVRRAEYFYCTHEDDVACLLQDGTTALKSELPEGATVLKERKTQVKRWKWCKLVGGHDEPVETQDWLGEYLPIIAVVGKELNVDGEIIRKGIVRDLKDPARMVNYAYSETVQTLALQNKVPYIAASEAIEGFEDKWGAANLDNLAYLPFNAYDDNGNPLPKPERQAPAVMPAAQVQLLQLSTEEMRAASGQQNANFGIKSEAASGVGIQRLKAQGEVATFHFPDNLARGLRYEAKVLIDLIQKYYDSRRVVRILGLDGKEETAVLNPELEVPFQEVEDAQGGVQKIFNPQVGRYDVVIDTGPSFHTQRQEAQAAMTELTGRSPGLMEVAGDIIMRAFDFPFSEELAERIRKTLPPALQENGAQDLPPEVKLQLEEMGRQMQAMQQAGEELQRENEALKAEKGLEFKKLIIEAYAKETDRLKALGGAMTPEAVQALVMQTLQQVMNSPDPTPTQEPPPMAAPIQQEPAAAGFSLPVEGMDTPAAMPATGA